MFLNWISDLQFIEQEAGSFFSHSLCFLKYFQDSGIFLDFPAPIRKDLASLVSSHLLRVESFVFTLKTTKHVDIMLEILGQSFSLEMSESKIIRNVIEIYEKWLLTNQSPIPVKQNIEHYIIVYNLNNQMSLV